MNADSSLGLLIFVVLVIVNAVLSAGYSALVNGHKSHLRELADDGDKRAQRVLDNSEDAKHLLTSRQFVGILLRFFAAGILTLVLGRLVIDFFISLAMIPQTAQVLGYIIVWVFGAIVMLVLGELIPT